MPKSTHRVGVLLTTCAVALLTARMATGAELRIDDSKTFNIGLRVQTRALWLEVDTVKGGDPDNARIDFEVRRAYLLMNGNIDKRYEYAATLAADGAGRAGVSSPDIGLGSGLAVRDAWVGIQLAPEAKLLVGRMLVPFFRQVGTASTGSLHSMDLPTFQLGGIQPGRRVARDDGAMLMGNINGGQVQYRIAVMDAGDRVPKSSLRIAGRVTLDLIDKDPGFYRSMATIDGKRVLSLGVAADRLPDFEPGVDHFGIVGDAYCAMPVGNSTIVIGEVDFASIDQDDTRYTGTYLLGIGSLYLRKAAPVVGNLHPFVRFEKFTLADDVKTPTNDDTEIGVGINVYPGSKGQTCKATAEFVRTTPAVGDARSSALVQLQLSY